MHKWRFTIIRAIYAISYLLLLSTSTCSFATEAPDAKSIPKPILMLALYCNSAKIVMKKGFDLAPTAPPWSAEIRYKDAIDHLMKSIDVNDSGYEKAVNDGALTNAEANFLKYSATHEAELWLKNIANSCFRYLGNAKEYEICLQDNNSEIYKCYRQIREQIDLHKKK